MAKVSTRKVSTRKASPKGKVKASPKVKASEGKIPAADFRAECERRRSERLVVFASKATRVHGAKLKEMGGIWDGFHRAILMPDEAGVTAANKLIAS